MPVELIRIRSVLAVLIIRFELASPCIDDLTTPVSTHLRRLADDILIFPTTSSVSAGFVLLIPTLPLASFTNPPAPTFSVSVAASPKIVLPVVISVVTLAVAMFAVVMNAVVALAVVTLIVVERSVVTLADTDSIAVTLAVAMFAVVALIVTTLAVAMFAVVMKAEVMFAVVTLAVVIVA